MLRRSVFDPRESGNRRMIVAQVRGASVVLWDGARFREATVAKRARTAASVDFSFVAVGDRVAVEGDAGAVRVTSIEPRQSFLGRVARGSQDRIQVLAANAEQAVIVASVADPPFRPGLVDRWALLALRGGMTPVLALNKVDLSTRAAAGRLVDEASIPLEAIYLSAVTGEGLEDLRSCLAGRTSVLVGHSGVGKSKILSRIFPAEVIVSGELSGKSGKGRHTTASARMYLLPGGGHVIDTPGVRMVPIGPMHYTEVAEVFPEIHGAPLCRFRPCSHRTEPGCSVKAGVESGTVPGVVYRRYLRLLEEVGTE